jgi:serine/threonine-protein kinase RsbW
VRTSGDVDAVNVPLIRDTIDEAISAGCRTVVLDLSEVDYIDSSALGLLVWADHRLSPLAGTLLLAGAGRDVARILELSGLIGVAPSVFVAESVDAALTGLSPLASEGTPLWTQTFQVAASASVMAETRSRIVDLLAPLGLSESALFDVKVATGEALANAVRHGSPRGSVDAIGVAVDAFVDRVEVTVLDSGKGFDGSASPSDDVYAPSGRGVLFMRALMDAVEFTTRDGGGTSVKLMKRRLHPVVSPA